jgi:hypothetical protein
MDRGQQRVVHHRDVGIIGNRQRFGGVQSCPEYPVGGGFQRHGFDDVVIYF